MIFLKTHKYTGHLSLSSIIGTVAPYHTELLINNLKNYEIPDSQIDIIIK